MRGCKALNAAFDCADESLRALLLRACRCFWPVELAALDQMLEQVQDAHLCAYAEENLAGAALDEARAARIRSMLKGY